MLPDSTSASTVLSMGSASPVSNDSSISSPSVETHRPVGRHLVTGPQLEQVVEHDVLDRDLSHRTVAHRPAPAAR